MTPYFIVSLRELSFASSRLPQKLPLSRECPTRGSALEAAPVMQRHELVPVPRPMNEVANLVATFAAGDRHSWAVSYRGLPLRSKFATGWAADQRFNGHLRCCLMRCCLMRRVSSSHAVWTVHCPSRFLSINDGMEENSPKDTFNLLQAPCRHVQSRWRHPLTDCRRLLAPCAHSLTWPVETWSRSCSPWRGTRRP